MSAADAELQALPQALALFERFEAEGLRYSSFKSNEHLLDGLAGLTDLDLLADPSQASLAERLLLESGFKRFNSGFSSRYPTMQDHLGFDPESGKLIHVHLHFSLILGAKHEKGHQLPFVGEYLRTSRVDEATGVRIADPNYEMLLLLVRYALKQRWRDYLLRPTRRAGFVGNAAEEFAWLQERLDAEKLGRITTEHLGESAGALIPELIREVPSRAQLRRLRRAAAPALRRARTYPKLTALGLRYGREAIWWLSGVNKRTLGLPLGMRRTSASGGRVIAILGPDGSGKSTVSAELRKWLAWKVDVVSIYLGSGDGSTSLLRWPLRATHRSR